MFTPNDTGVATATTLATAVQPLVSAGLGLLLLLSVLLGTMGCSAKAASVPWRTASDIAPKPLIEQVIAQQTEATGQEAQVLADTMQAW